MHEVTRNNNKRIIIWCASGVNIQVCKILLTQNRHTPYQVLLNNLVDIIIWLGLVIPGTAAYPLFPVHCVHWWQDLDQQSSIKMKLLLVLALFIGTALAQELCCLPQEFEISEGKIFVQFVDPFMFKCWSSMQWLNWSGSAPLECDNIFFSSYSGTPTREKYVNFARERLTD